MLVHLGNHRPPEAPTRVTQVAASPGRDILEVCEALSQVLQPR